MFWQFSPFLMPQQPKFYLELNSLNNFKRGPPKEHSCEVILKSVHLLVGEVFCRKLLTDGRTDDDRRRTASEHKSSPRTSCLGELKTLWQKEKVLVLSNFFFCHNVFKSHLLQRGQKAGKG